MPTRDTGNGDKERLPEQPFLAVPTISNVRDFTWFTQSVAEELVEELLDGIDSVALGTSDGEIWLGFKLEARRHPRGHLAYLRIEGVAHEYPLYGLAVVETNGKLMGWLQAPTGEVRNEDGVEL